METQTEGNEVKQGNFIAITHENYKSLKELFNISLSKKLKPNDVVQWRGKDILLGYLKYVLMAMEARLGKA